MKRFAIAPAILAGLAAAGCASTPQEQLEDIQARALAACPAAIERSENAGEYGYTLETCECIAGRITTPLWSDADSAYTGAPMAVEDARLIAGAISKAPTLTKGLEDAEPRMSTPAANSINTCYAKY